MAARLMVWAEIGKPNQREWAPGARRRYAKNDGLYPSGYYLFDATVGRLRAPSRQREDRLRRAKPARHRAEAKPVSYEIRLWKGWMLPASDADTWFVAGSAATIRMLASDELEKADRQPARSSIAA